jgi:hypothetical protein
MTTSKMFELPFGFRTQGQFLQFKVRVKDELGIKVLESDLFKRLFPDINLYICRNGKYIFYGITSKQRESELKSMFKIKGRK